MPFCSRLRVRQRDRRTEQTTATNTPMKGIKSLDVDFALERDCRLHTTCQLKYEHHLCKIECHEYSEHHHHHHHHEFIAENMKKTILTA